MNATLTAFCGSLMLGALTCCCRAEDFGISRKNFDAGFHTVFTFRNNVLVYELTLLGADSPVKNGWIERFYVAGQEALLRAGAAEWSSTHYSGSSRVSIVRGGRRLYVGHEAFNMGEDGFYHIVEDPKSTLLESTIDDPVFSTRTLDQERQKYLDQSKPHE